MNDKKQRTQALNIEQSFIVQAPAGSGKTELLTQRYLKLLSVCTSPENIIALTFTNKAVNELNERVLLALKSTASPRPSLPHKQLTYDLACLVMQRSDEKNWQLLQTPQRLKISTIDGLSNLITSKYANSAQWIPPRIMVEQYERDKAYQTAGEKTLLLINEPEHQQVISKLLLYLDGNIQTFYALITPMMAKRDQWLPRLYRGDALDFKAIENSSKRIICAHLERLLVAGKPHFKEKFFALLAINSIDEYAQIKSLPAAKIDDLEAWKNLRTILLTGKNQWRKIVTKKEGFALEVKEQKNEFISILQQLENQSLLQKLLSELDFMPDIKLAETQKEILKTVSQVLKLCTAQLNILFAKEQAIDFIEVALRADNALNEQTNISDIALFLDYKIEHILIDEFQDTSVSQFALIEKLINNWQENDGKTLFLVGDPMQSIYRFRESQVGLFLQVKKLGIAHLKPKSLILTTNFRSSKNIVAHNNDLFAQIFPAEDDIYQGAISYAAAECANLKTKGCVHFHPFSPKQYQQEAECILKIIKQTLSKNADTTIAVLVRGRAHLQHIIQTLKANNINFEAINTAPLKEQLLTRDLLSLSKALLHLGDKGAWLAVLRAPWCGLLLQDLLVFADNDEQIIYQQLSDKKILARLTKDGRKRSKHIQACLQSVIDNQSRFSFVEILTFAINQLGLAPASISAEELMIRNKFLQIIFTCEAASSLNIDTIEAMLANLYTPPQNANVKLMTIHSAKGLEFDSVIIPALDRSPRQQTSPIIHLQTFAEQSLLLAPIKPSSANEQSATYAYLKFIDNNQQAFETMRLLYVAMTRAKNELHLLGALGQSKKPAKKSLLALLLPFYQSAFNDLNAPTEILNEPLKSPQLKRLRHLQTYTLPPTTTPHKSVEAKLSLTSLYKSLLGTLVHQYFQQESFHPTAEAISSKLIEAGFAPNQIKQNTKTILQLLANSQNDPQFKWLFKKRESTLTEAEFIDETGVIIIDRLFIDADILWIIDFKTAAPKSTESTSKFISRQQSKHAKQLLSYQKTLSQIYPHKIKCALYCPAIQKLIEIT